MPKTRVQKEEIVTALKEKLAGAKSIVFADYRGLTMAQLSDLRNKLRSVGGKFNITKNTLLNLALPDSSFEGPTAILITKDDEISPIKILVKTMKDAGIGQIKGGFLGNQVLDAATVNQLALLPTKDELRAKTIGVLVAPIQGIVGVLQRNLRNLVYALSEISRLPMVEQKAKGGV